jgi:hypothetical protein
MLPDKQMTMNNQAIRQTNELLTKLCNVNAIIILRKATSGVGTTFKDIATKFHFPPSFATVSSNWSNRGSKARTYMWPVVMWGLFTARAATTTNKTRKA